MFPIRPIQAAAALACAGLTLSLPGNAWAQEEAEANAKQRAQESQRRAALRSVARGFYIETRFGGGYMVLNQKLGDMPDDRPDLQAIEGQSESFGGGAMIHFAVGYDITDMFALELVGGASFAAGGRQANDWTRDLGLYFGGGAARVQIELLERLFLLLSAGGGYVIASNAVEPSQAGAVVLANVGIEYFVHVRHFSVGLAVSGLVPVSPMRGFVAIAPQIKYSF